MSDLQQSKRQRVSDEMVTTAASAANVASVAEAPVLTATDATTIAVTDKFYKFGLYTGDWDPVSNSPHGIGQWFKVGVLVFDGQWKYGQWDGPGTVFDQKTGLKVCTGTYLNGSLHGFATLYEEDGVTVETESYHVFGEDCPEITTKEDFDLKVREKQEEQKRKQEEQQQKSAITLSTGPIRAANSSSSSTVSSFSFTLTKDSPIMSAPITGLFPRYTDVPVKMLEGCALNDLEDDEIPTPSNLEDGKTREDWLVWVRTFYPRN